MRTTRRLQAALLVGIMAATSLAWAIATPPAGADLSTMTPDDLCLVSHVPIGGVVDVVVDAEGTVWWLEGGLFSLPAIGRRTPDGRITRFAEGLLIDRDLLHSLTLGADGNVWFTSFSNVSGGDKIGRLTPEGVITLFDTGLTQGSFVNEITAGPDGNLWFTEALNNVIGRITPAGVITEFPFPGEGPPGAGGITSGPGGHLWFASGTDIGRMSTTGDVTMFAEGIGELGAHGAADITAGADGNLWFVRGGTDVGSREIGRMTPNGVVEDIDVPPAPAVLLGAEGSGVEPSITTGPDGNVWFTDWFAGRVGRVTPSGEATTFTDGARHDVGGALPSTSGPVGITPAPDGSLWFGTSIRFGDVGANRGLSRITTEGVVTEFGGVAFGSSAEDVVAGPDGNMWYAGLAGITRISPRGDVAQFFDGFGTLQPNGTFSYTQPQGITAGPDGNLWFTEAAADRIGRITPDGVITRFAAGISPGSTPFGITAGPDGNLWFTEAGASRIGRITPAGVVTEFSAGITPGNAVKDITAGPDGNLWFTDEESIGRIDPDDGVVTEFRTYPEDFGGPVLNGITAGPDGNVWFGHFFGAIGRITPTGEVTLFEEGISNNPNPAVPSRPADIVAADGVLWFTLPFTGQLGRITVDGGITLFEADPPSLGSLSVEPYPNYPLTRPTQLTTGPEGGLWWTNGGGILGAPKVLNGFERDDIGEPCVPDEDMDTFVDGEDAFPFDPTEWLDTDADSVGDNGDNCPAAANLDQADLDGDDAGDVCDPDDDGGTDLDVADNCPRNANPDQADGDGDGVGDVCDRTVFVTKVKARGLFLDATLVDGAGRPVAGVPIEFVNRSGRRLCVTTTNVNGLAHCLFPLAAFMPWLGGVEARFAGDALHDPASAHTWKDGTRPRTLVGWLLFGIRRAAD